MEKRYDIVRHFLDSRLDSQIIRRGVTLEEARKHCLDPETSCTTATSAEAKRRTETKGPWFDGFREA